MQFLINFDGSIPAGANVEALTALGIPLVRPSPRPAPILGMEIKEGEPRQIDGVWWQTWNYVDSPQNEELVLPDLTRWQFAKFIATPPLRAALLAAETLSETTDQITFADFQGCKQMDLHVFSKSILIVKKLLSNNTNNNIDDETIQNLWIEAANF